MKLKAAAIALLTVSLTALSFQTAPQKAPFNDSINKDAMKSDLFFLAGDGFKGRLTDTPENSARRGIHQVALRENGA